MIYFRSKNRLYILHNSLHTFQYTQSYPVNGYFALGQSGTRNVG